MTPYHLHLTQCEFSTITISEESVTLVKPRNMTRRMRPTSFSGSHFTTTLADCSGSTFTIRHPSTVVKRIMVIVTLSQTTYFATHLVACFQFWFQRKEENPEIAEFWILGRHFLGKAGWLRKGIPKIHKSLNSGFWDVIFWGRPAGSEKAPRKSRNR